MSDIGIAEDIAYIQKKVDEDYALLLAESAE